VTARTNPIGASIGAVAVVEGGVADVTEDYNRRVLAVIAYLGR
jgi:hypothetical protein